MVRSQQQINFGANCSEKLQISCPDVLKFLNKTGKRPKDLELPARVKECNILTFSI